MFEFSDILPFSSRAFFWFFLASVLFMYVAKYLKLKILTYENALLLVSTSYLLLLFPKPLQLIALVLYSYGLFHFFVRIKKLEGILIPILLLALPMVAMKVMNRIHVEEGQGETLMHTIFQIAGLSYITFKAIQFYIDERERADEATFLKYFHFLVFVPTLLIGPIDRYKRFNENVQLGYKTLNANSFEQGWVYLIKGLLYKFIFATILHQLILTHLVKDGSMTYHLLYMFTYLFYLFFDFAGYSLLAMSFGSFLGIQVPYNFDRPFLSENPKQFWVRWHKTLGDWLNDYFFKPIFKELTSKQIGKPIQRQNLALFLTFTLMGFWNGFEFHYIVSGMLFGTYSMIHNYYIYRCKKDKRDVVFGNLSPVIVRILSISTLFVGVAFAIYIFSGELF